MEPNFLSTARTLLAIPGFLQPLVAFVASIAVSNVVSAFVKDTLVSSGMTSQTTINLAGAGFQAAIVLGGILLGGYVDRSKRYKEVTLGCFVMALLLLQPLGLTDCPSSLVLISLLGLGALVGPVQPINAELAYAAPDSDISSELPSTVRLHRLSMFTPVLSYFSPLCLQAPDREPLSLSLVGWKWHTLLMKTPSRHSNSSAATSSPPCWYRSPRALQLLTHLCLGAIASPETRCCSVESCCARWCTTPLSHQR